MRLKVVSGDHQTGISLEYLPKSLVVQALDGWGWPVRDAEIHFHVPVGMGGIVADSHHEPQADLTIKTDASGLAQVDFRSPFVPNAKYKQSAKAIVSTIYAADKGSHQVAFTVTSKVSRRIPLLGPTNVNAAPGDGLGEIALSWEFIDNDHFATYFVIEDSTDNVHWTRIAVIQDTEARTYTATGLDPTQSYYFRIAGANDND